MMNYGNLFSFFRVNFLCRLVFGLCPTSDPVISTSVLLQWHVKDPSHFHLCVTAVACKDPSHSARSAVAGYTKTRMHPLTQ